MHAGGGWAEIDTLALAGVVAGIAAVYSRGLRVLWSRAGTGGSVSRRRALAFGAGLACLAAALSPPVEALAARLFSAHMIQHLLLLSAAAPLLVLGRADTVFLWALPQRARRSSAAALHRSSVARAARRLLHPLVVLPTAVGVLWLWHVPALYDAAVRNDLLHGLEHGTFLTTAMLFWHGVLPHRRRAMLDNGGRLLMIGGFAMQAAVLGALITFAAVPLYDSYAEGSPAHGLTALEDQQLAGLIMWIPPILVYLCAAAVGFVGWIDAIAARRERLDMAGRKRQVSIPAVER